MTKCGPYLTYQNGLWPAIPASPGTYGFSKHLPPTLNISSPGNELLFSSPSFWSYNYSVILTTHSFDLFSSWSMFPSLVSLPTPLSLLFSPLFSSHGSVKSGLFQMSSATFSFLLTTNHFFSLTISSSCYVLIFIDKVGDPSWVDLCYTLFFYKNLTVLECLLLSWSAETQWTTGPSVKCLFFVVGLVWFWFSILFSFLVFLLALISNSFISFCNLRNK